MYLYDYHQWDNGNNPRIDKITNTLLNLKCNKPARANSRNSSINFFSKVVTSQFGRILEGSPRSFCIVPSHAAYMLGYGLMAVMDNIQENFSFSNTDNLLSRTETIDKLSEGGCRDIQLHQDTIAVVNPEFVEGHVIYLFDDISSTGNSLQASKNLLLEAGASKVVMISFGQTWAE